MRVRHPLVGGSRHWTPYLALGTLLLALVLSLAGPGQKTPAEVQGPGPMQRQVTYMVRSLLERDHLLKRQVDDTISRRALKIFLSQLDPLKIYFYQSDIDRFMESQTALDDDFRRGDLSLSYKVFEVFLRRVDERLETINQLLDGSFDFTVDEQLITDPDQRNYPVDAQQAEDFWRKRLKYDLLVFKADDTSDEEARDRLRRRYKDFARRMRHMTDDDLMERYLSAITSSFDPHSSYMSQSTLDDFEIVMRLSLEGIGAELKAEDGYVIVNRVLPGGAASKHGKLKPQDQIVSVGQGADGEMVDVVEFSLKEVVSLIRGQAGTVVRLGVKSPGNPEIQTYEITRAKVELKDSEAQAKIFEAGYSAEGKPFRIGVIDLPSFYMDMAGAQRGLSNYKSTTRDVARLLDEFKKQEVDAVVLDLRQNGGGSLTEAVNLTGLFIDQGPVVQVKDSNDRIQQYDDTRPGMAWSGPLVVVTSKFSASASEILAGAIQDYRRGLVIGDSATHGKGTVQHLLELGAHLFPGVPTAPKLGALKITIQKFYRPSGKSTQLRGVLADLALPSITDHMDVSESDLEHPVEFDTIDSTELTDYELVSEEIIQQLAGRSEERQAESKEFANLMADVQRYREQKERKRIPLSEEEFLAMRKELDATEQDEKHFEQQARSDGEIERNYYMDEVLAIAADYVSLLQNGRKLATVNPATSSRAE